MRILIASPPKMGNTWLKHLLGSIYDLKLLTKNKKRLKNKKDEVPERADLGLFTEWVERGGFPDGTIFHQHHGYSGELCNIAAALPAHLVTIVRDPYDAFVSSYYNLQHKRPRLKHKLAGTEAEDRRNGSL